MENFEISRPRLPEIPLLRYKKDADLAVFLLAFERRLEYHQCSEEDAIALLEEAVVNTDVEVWLQEYLQKYGRLVTWRALVQDLQTGFKEAKWTLRQALEDRKMEEGEKIEQYLDAKLRLIRRYNPKMELEEQIDYIQHGLPLRFMEKMMGRYYKSLDDLRLALRKLERDEKLLAELRKSDPERVYPEETTKRFVVSEQRLQQHSTPYRGESRDHRDDGATEKRRDIYRRGRRTADYNREDRRRWSRCSESSSNSSVDSSESRYGGDRDVRKTGRSSSGAPDRQSRDFYETIVMVHDGNCLFRCFSYALFGRQGDFPEIRLKLVKYVLENWERFKNFAVDSCSNPFPSKTAYRKFALCVNRMGDFSDVVAFSDLYDCPVRIFRGDDVTLVGEARPGKQVNLLFTGSVDCGYYDFLEVSRQAAPSRSSYAAALRAKPALVSCTSPSAVGFALARAVQLGARQQLVAEGRPQAQQSTRPPAHHLHKGSATPTGRAASQTSRRCNAARKQADPAKHLKNVDNSRHLVTSNRFALLGEQPLDKAEETAKKRNGRLTTVSFKKRHKQALCKPEQKKVQHRSPTLEKMVNTIASPTCLESIDGTYLISNLEVWLGEGRVEALLDTGASLNVIQTKTLRELVPDAKIEKTCRVLLAANDTNIGVRGFWKGSFRIGELDFCDKFYVCNSLTRAMILGNPFLRHAQATIDYGNRTVSFPHRFGDYSVPFGTLVEAENDFGDLQELCVEEIYSGPQFIYSKSSVRIPPKTIKWIKVGVAPHKILTDTVFVGNPCLARNRIRVSDFMLSSSGAQMIQVTNFGNESVLLSPEWKLAVNEEHDRTFTGVHATVQSVEISSTETSPPPEFQINKNLCPEDKKRAESLLESFRDVFISDVADLRRCKYPPIRIDYDPNKTVRQRNYRMSVDEKEFAEKYIEKLLKSDLVEYCTSVYCTPILIVPKQGHSPATPSYRMVQDFRKINKILTDLKYPIPDQQDLIDSFQGKYWHSVTDNCSGYTQLTIHPSCRDITAFDSPSGSRFRWKSLPQGLSVAPALYALAMDHLLMKLKKKKTLVNYFDDTYLGTETFNEHLENLNEYFELLREHRIKLNIKKSTFFQPKVIFLGLNVDGETVSVTEKRVAAIKKMKPPTSTDELRTSLGVFGYNRKFIRNYSQKAFPLLSLMKKKEDFVWGKEQQEAFDALKSDLSSPLSLKLFDPNANNRVTVDASYKGLGCAFYQMDKKSKRYCPVAFASRKLKPSEAKLPVYYLECSAMMYAFVTFRCYLQNRNVDTEVLTDHQSLQSLMRTPKPEGALAKYILYLSQFKFSIRYRPGKSNQDADCLSRFPVEEPEKTVDELVDEVFPDTFATLPVAAVTTRGGKAREQEAQENAAKLDEENNRHVSLANDMLTTDPLYLRYLQSKDHVIQDTIRKLELQDGTERSFVVREDLLYRLENGRHKLVVPENCRKFVLVEFHDNRGHRATKHFLKNISEYFWWPSLPADCKHYYQSCRYCQLHRKDNDKPGLLTPTISPRPFAMIACDFVGALPLTSHKKMHVCVIVDYYTKYMWTRAVRSADTETAVNCLKSFSMAYGLCDSYTTDSASYFTSFAFKKVLEHWQIFHNAFRRVPHCNGQVERTIQSLKNILAQLLLELGDDWDTHLELATFLYNVNYHETIGCSPFFALHGFKPLTPGLLQMVPPDSVELPEKIRQHAQNLKNLQIRVRNSQSTYKRHYDKTRRHVQYAVGQCVRVARETKELGWPAKKEVWKGPFKIVGKKSEKFYFILKTLRTVSGKKKHVVREFHVRNMRPYVKRQKTLRVPRQPSVSVVTIPLHPSRIKHVDGDVLCAPYGDVIAHCISADGAMSAGFARILDDFFKLKMAVSSFGCKVGDAVLVESNGRWIFNLVTKEKYLEKPTYESLRKCLMNLRFALLRHGFRYLALPKIGCGRDGLDLPKVLQILADVFTGSGVIIYMYHWHGDGHDMLTIFRHDFQFLSNFSLDTVVINGRTYPSVEHAYQSAKAVSLEDSDWVANAESPAVARVRGRTVWMRSDWSEVRLEVMARCVVSKFLVNTEIRRALRATGDRFLIEENQHCDQFYGSCLCREHRLVPGSNHLGRLLMLIRRLFRPGSPRYLELSEFLDRNLIESCTVPVTTPWLLEKLGYE